MRVPLLRASFAANTAAGLGGALYVDTMNNVNISGSNFTQNRAGSHGGAVAAGTGNGVAFVAAPSVFSRNGAVIQGGYVCHGAAFAI